MDTKHMPAPDHEIRPEDITKADDYRRTEIPRSSPWRKLKPVRPEGLGFHMPRRSTGQPRWFAEMVALRADQ